MRALLVNVILSVINKNSISSTYSRGLILYSSFENFSIGLQECLMTKYISMLLQSLNLISGKQ